MANPSPAGLEGVVAGQSAISMVYGDEGRLIYRGYDIKDLAEHATFEETVYLLWYGKLPTRPELDILRKELQENRAVPDGVIEYLKGLPHTAPTMTWLQTAVSALGMYDSEANDNSPEANRRKAVRLVAQTPTLTAAIGRIRANLEPVPPKDDGCEACNFLYMLKGEWPDDTTSRAYDVALVLHADHEFNASTFTARVIASTLANIYAATSGAIGALSGPLHGGANEQVMKYLSVLEQSGQDPEEWVEQQLAAGAKVPGFGHRVYRTLDPRAAFLREMGRSMAETSGRDQFFRISEKVYEAVTSRKKINANVDYFSASVFADLGMPVILYSPSFACSRMAGWTAHYMEQMADNRIIRPRSDYVGDDHLAFVPIDQRS